MSPAYPDGWTKTIADLASDGAQHAGEELEWAWAYEQDVLKQAGARFPRAGDVYEAVRDVEITAMTHWRAPVTGGESAVLPAGTKLVVRMDTPHPEPIGVYADGLEAAALETVVVPASDRRRKTYAGYSLFVRTAQLNRDFVLVDSVHPDQESALPDVRT